MTEVLKVSSRSNPHAVAGALAGVVRHDGVAELRVVGAGALNQAVKAVVIARGFLVTIGTDLVCVPSFGEVDIAGDLRTAIRLVCEDRRRLAGEPGAATARSVTANLTTAPLTAVPEGERAVRS